MVTNSPRLFVAPAESTPHPEVTPLAEGIGERMLDRVREAVCALHGHDNLLQFEHDRMFLKCISCGHESPGWELNETPPGFARKVDAHRPVLVRSRLSSERRIA